MWRAGIPPTVRGQVARDVMHRADIVIDFCFFILQIWATAIGNTLQLSRAEYLRLIEVNSNHTGNSPGLGQSPSKLIEIDVPRYVSRD